MDDVVSADIHAPGGGDPGTSAPRRHAGRSTYSLEFKRNAVDRLRHRGTRGAVNAVAEEIGIHPTTLSAWSRMFPETEDDAAARTHAAAYPLTGLAWCVHCRQQWQCAAGQPVPTYGCACRAIPADTLHTAVYRAVIGVAPRAFDPADEPGVALIAARRILLRIVIGQTASDLSLRWRPTPLPATHPTARPHIGLPAYPGAVR